MKKISMLIGIILLSGCASDKSPMSKADPVSIPNAKLEDALVSYASASLYDPMSAQYRNIRTYRVTRQNGSVETQICGEVNARNRMGGYAGFKPFMIVPAGDGGYFARGHYKCPE